MGSFNDLYPSLERPGAPRDGDTASESPAPYLPGPGAASPAPLSLGLRTFGTQAEVLRSRVLGDRRGRRPARGQLVDVDLGSHGCLMPGLAFEIRS